MKSLTFLFLTCSVLAGLASRTAAAPGDFQDNFDEPTLQPAWESAQIVNGANLPTGWSVEEGILRCYWAANWGQEHLIVATSMEQFTIQARCRLDTAANKDSGAALILKAQYSSTEGDTIPSFLTFGIGDGKDVFAWLRGNNSWGFPKIGTRPDLQLGTWHTLKAEINGAHIRCFLDNEMVYETDRPGYTGNYFGVGATVKADVSFDDFQITSLQPERPAATSRAVGSGQFIDTGWPMGSGSQETVTFMVVADPASTDPAKPAPAHATFVMDSPAIRKYFGDTLILQGTPDSYVEGGVWTQDPKVEKDLYFKMDNRLIMAGFNDNGYPGNNPDWERADWVFLFVTDATTGQPLFTVTGPLTSGDVMDYVPATTPTPAPALSVSKVMQVSWPHSLTPFKLEGASAVDGAWQPVDCWVIENSGECQAFLPIATPMKLFRLVEAK